LENNIPSQAPATGNLLLTATYLLSLPTAGCTEPYPIGEELIKPSLASACNVISGQSAANTRKDFVLSNVAVESRISDVAEDTETKLTEEIEKRSKLFALQLGESADIILLIHARYIDHDESDTEEGILSVCELPMHSEIFKVLIV
jgi:hypothetical protein